MGIRNKPDKHSDPGIQRIQLQRGRIRHYSREWSIERLKVQRRRHNRRGKRWDQCNRHRCALGEERTRSEEHTSELQSLRHLVCRLLLEKKNEETNSNVCWRLYPSRACAWRGVRRV